ncbi:hypothetical protein [Ponticoccus litoralis]|uniref:Uncharacterized protein n=1 Tax=Ponticoccus litoralis TaxID=422297 RepID=A0AAW9SDG8_9RHOB
MTRTASPTHGTDDSALWHARAAVADVTSHDDATVAAACSVIENNSTDPDERDRARDLRVLIEGETA